MATNPKTEPVELTPKKCRYCRGPYLSPKGARWAGCLQCCPTIMDAVKGVENERLEIRDIWAEGETAISNVGQSNIIPF